MRYYNGIRTGAQSLPQQLFQKFEDKNKPTKKSNNRENYPSHVHAFNFVVAGKLLYYSFNIEIEG